MAVSRGGSVPGVAPEGDGYVVTSFDLENGLPDSTVNDVLQTRDGYLWVATSRGLARFDGVRFTVFNSLNTPALQNDEFYCLLEDSGGGLWVGNKSTVLRYREGRFESAAPDRSWATNQLVLTWKDAEGDIWLRVRSREWQSAVRVRDGRYSLYPRPGHLAAPAVIQAVDSLGRFWNGTAADMKLGIRCGPLWESNGVPISVVGMIASPSADGGLWFVASDRLRKVKDGRLVFDRFLFPTPDRMLRLQLTSIFEDTKGRLWLGTAGGGVYWLGADGRPVRMSESDRPIQHPVKCFFEDREGNVWVGTDGGGLIQMRSRRLLTLLLPDGSREHNFTSVCPDKRGGLWVGTDGGGVFRLRDGKWTHIGDEDGLPDSHVFTVFEDSRTNLWVGTTSGLFLRESNSFQQVGGPGQIGRWVLALHEDHAGAVWVGSYGTLSRVQGGKIEVLTEPRGVLPRCSVPAFAEDSEGNLWIGTDQSGLIRFKEGKITRFGPESGLNDNGIRALLTDADGTLWIGLSKNGIYRLRQGVFTHYTMSDGLPDNRIQSLLDDGAGNLWAAAMDGIFSVSKQELEDHALNHARPLKCLRLSLADGLVSRQCSGRGQPTAARLPDGTFWIPNQHGLATFNPGRMKWKSSPLPVQVEEVLVNNQLHEPDAAGGLRLDASDGLFEFHYTAAEFSAPDTLRFRYKLEGLDGKWVDASSRRVTYYGHVPAGRYQFRVMASSGTGEWYEAVRPLRLEIVLPLWQRGWFQALVLLAALGAVMGVALAAEKARARRKIRRLETQQALEKERRRIAQDIHDDIGSRLSSLTMLGEMTALRSLNLEQTRQRMAEMTVKTRELGRAMDEIIWTVNPRNDTIPSLVSYLQHFTTEYLEPSALRLRVDVPPGLPPVLLRAQARHNLFLAAKEAVHNVASHSGATEVWIRVSWLEPVLAILIEDNGRGFDLAKASALRNGLTNMRDRLQEIGGDCVVDSQPDRGCCVRLTLPLAEVVAESLAKITISRDGTNGSKPPS